MKFVRSVIFGAVAAFAFPACSSASICPALAHLANTAADASAALQDCIEKTPARGKLELPAGQLLVKRPLTIPKAITITTAGISDGAPSCSSLGERRCATILLDAISSTHPTSFPIDVNASGVILSHLVIEAANDPRLRADCGPANRRVYVGGLRIRGSDFALRKSVLRNFPCHTAMQVRAGYKGPTIQGNWIGPNGAHDVHGMWSDGITVHDGEGAVVEGNVFIDNTDVQLIFGGCRNCRIVGNVFRHRGAFSGASFAELMLNTFAGTSGNFAGTIVSGNRIDCGASKRCGYGIMLGAAPWQGRGDSSRPGGMSGGIIARNMIRNALIAINVDSPTGPVQISANQVESSGGVRGSDCGRRTWPAVNVAPQAVRFVKGNPSAGAEGHVSTAGCLIDRTPN